MSDRTSQSNHSPSPIEQAASDWVMRLDRGLTPSEQDAYTQWLAEDPRHREAIKLYSWGWDEFDRLAGLQTTRQARVDPDLLAPRKTMPFNRTLRLLSFAVPLAAAIALAFLYWGEADPRFSPAPTEQEEKQLLSRIERRELSDGTFVTLNRGSAIETAFTENHRRVYLRKGEANFEVAKNPDRPFVVNVAGIDVQAVGTIFNVRLTDDLVDVIVTEGKVRVAPGQESEGSLPAMASLPDLEVGHRVRLPLQATASAPAVETLSQAELESQLLWQPQLLDFDDEPLPRIVEAFNRRNAIQLRVADPELESLRLSSAFWSDNVEGFVRLMESSFGIQAKWSNRNTLQLTKKDPEPSRS